MTIISDSSYFISLNVLSLKKTTTKQNGGFEQGFEKFFRSRTSSWENQTLLAHAVTPMACLNNICLPLNNISPWKLPQVCRINMLIKFPLNQKTLFAIYWKLNTWMRARFGVCSFLCTAGRSLWLLWPWQIGKAVGLEEKNGSQPDACRSSPRNPRNQQGVKRWKTHRSRLTCE